MGKHKQEPVGTGHVFLLLSAVALMFLDIPTAIAQADDDTNFSLSLGVFFTDRNNTTRVDGTAGLVGTLIDRIQYFALMDTIASIRSIVWISARSIYHERHRKTLRRTSSGMTHCF
jgi:hypothetical protein